MLFNRSPEGTFVVVATPRVRAKPNITLSQLTDIHDGYMSLRFEDETDHVPKVGITRVFEHDNVERFPADPISVGFDFLHFDEHCCIPLAVLDLF